MPWSKSLSSPPASNIYIYDPGHLQQIGEGQQERLRPIPTPQAKGGRAIACTGSKTL